MRNDWRVAKGTRTLWCVPATPSRGPKVFFLKRAHEQSDNFARSTSTCAADSAASVPNLGTEQRARTDFSSSLATGAGKTLDFSLCTIAGLFLGLAYLARTPNFIRAHVVLEVDIQSRPLVRQRRHVEAGCARRFSPAQDAFAHLEQNLTNRTLLARVIRSEGLAEERRPRASRRHKAPRRLPKKDASTKK